MATAASAVGKRKAPTIRRGECVLKLFSLAMLRTNNATTTIEFQHAAAIRALTDRAERSVALEAAVSLEAGHKM
jgi:hypothetical protein